MVDDDSPSSTLTPPCLSPSAREKVSIQTIPFSPWFPSRYYWGRNSPHLVPVLHTSRVVDPGVHLGNVNIYIISRHTGPCLGSSLLCSFLGAMEWERGLDSSQFCGAGVSGRHASERAGVCLPTRRLYTCALEKDSRGQSGHLGGGGQGREFLVLRGAPMSITHVPSPRCPDR